MDILIEELNLLWEPIRPYLAGRSKNSMDAETGTFWKLAPFQASYFLSLRRMLARVS